MSAWFVGIDPASHDTGLFAADDDDNVKHALLRTKGDLPDRLRQLRAGVASFVASLNETGVWIVVVERPMTRHAGASLFAAFGVALEAARSSTDAVVMDLSPSQIDPLVGVNGGRSRKDRTARLAEAAGYAGLSQDEADAYVACLAGRVLVERLERAA